MTTHPLRRRQSALASSLLPLVSVLAPAALHAQETLLLEEVIVTSQRREERLLDVPVAVTAFTGAELTARGVQSTRDVLPDRKSTRLNSSHVKSSYAVFCAKKKRPQPAR